jgi:thioredoxin-like negative regulator of GroEL
VYGLLLRARTNELARRLSGRIAVARVDVQRWPYIADLLRIRRIPALVFLRGRLVIHRWYGADVDVSFVETIALRRAVEERR